MTDQDLCQWLRDTSSGIYRNSALAADRIEELQKELNMFRSFFTTADNEVVKPDDKVWVRGSTGTLSEALVDIPRTNYFLYASGIPVSESYKNKESVGGSSN